MVPTCLYVFVEVLVIPLHFVERACCQSARFQTCCENGMKAALELASWCSKVPTEKLEKWYQDYCAVGFWDTENDALEEDELEMGDEELACEETAKNECTEFLDALQAETVEPSAFKVGDEQAESTEERHSETVDNDLAGVPDREQLEELMEKPAILEPFGSEQSRSGRKRRPLPGTLRHALANKGCRLNSIFRLCLRLRSMRGGLDSGFLKNPQNTRRAASALNWYQPHGKINRNEMGLT